MTWPLANQGSWGQDRVICLFILLGRGVESHRLTLSLRKTYIELEEQDGLFVCVETRVTIRGRRAAEAVLIMCSDVSEEASVAMLFSLVFVSL